MFGINRNILKDLKSLIDRNASIVLVAIEVPTKRLAREGSAINKTNKSNLFQPLFQYFIHPYFDILEMASRRNSMVNKASDISNRRQLGQKPPINITIVFRTIATNITRSLHNHFPNNTPIISW